MIGFIPLIAGVVAGIIGATVLIPRLVVSVLKAVGFSAAGPVAGSFATWIQSGMGTIATGSLFSSAQAIAMGARTPVLARVIGGAVIGLAVLSLVSWALLPPLRFDVVVSSRSPAPLSGSL